MGVSPNRCDYFCGLPSHFETRAANRSITGHAAPTSPVTKNLYHDYVSGAHCDMWLRSI
jgi:hypothetical protein